jgi:hypothetical protein
MHRFLAIGAVVLLALTSCGAAAAWSWPSDGAVLRAFALGADAYAAGQHRGIDVAGPDGSQVRAPASGVVTFAGSLPTYGRGVTILTADGYAVTLVHLGAIGVAEGQTVSEGAPIGTMGTSGTPEQSAPSVHLGIRRASDEQGYVDPLGLLPPRAFTPAPSRNPTPSPEPATRTTVQAPAPLSPSPASTSTAPPSAPLQPTEPPATVLSPPPTAPLPTQSSGIDATVQSRAAAPSAASPPQVSVPPGGAVASAPEPTPTAADRSTPEPAFEVTVDTGEPMSVARRSATVTQQSTVAAGRSVLPRPVGGVGGHVSPTASRNERPPASGAAPPRPPAIGVEADAASPRRAPVGRSASGEPRVGAAAHPAAPTTRRKPSPGAAAIRRGDLSIPRPISQRVLGGGSVARASGHHPAAPPHIETRGDVVPVARRRLDLLRLGLLSGLLVLAAAVVGRQVARRIGGDGGALLRHHADLLRELDPAHRARVHDRGRGRLRPPSAPART